MTKLFDGISHILKFRVGLKEYPFILYSLLFFSFFGFIQLRTPMHGLLLKGYLAFFCVIIIANLKSILQEFNKISIYNKSVLLLSIWATISVTWSPVPSISIYRLLYLYILIAITALIVRHMRIDSIAQVIKNFMIFALILDVLVIILVPSIGMKSGLSGFHYQKNQFGTILSIMIFSLMALPNRRAEDYIATGIALFLLAISGSKTSFALVLMLYPLVKFIKYIGPKILNKKSHLFFTLLIIITIYLSVNSVLTYIQYNLDSEFMTGRGQIWQLLLSYQEDFYKGTGYGSFWDIGNHSSLVLYFDDPSTEWMKIIEQTHNGYLDCFATLGFVGLVLLFGILGNFIFTLLNLKTHMYSNFYISFCIFFLIHNFSETSILYYASPLWTFFWLIFFMSGKETYVSRKS